MIEEQFFLKNIIPIFIKNWWRHYKNADISVFFVNLLCKSFFCNCTKFKGYKLNNIKNIRDGGQIDPPWKNYPQKVQPCWGQNDRNLIISVTIYFKKISARRFEDHIRTNKLDNFFFQNNFFSKTWSFFHDYKTTDLGLIFFHKKIILCFFSNLISM